MRLAESSDPENLRTPARGRSSAHIQPTTPATARKNGSYATRSSYSTVKDSSLDEVQVRR